MARKRKRQPESSGVKGAPQWVVTFTDMISLLVTFFVLLMTFSSMEEYDKLYVDGFLTGTRGVIRQVGGQKAYETVDDDFVAATDIRRGADRPHSRDAESLDENLDEMGQTKGDGEVEVDFSAIADGLQIVFAADCAFELGSSRVNEPLRKALSELAEVLQHYSHLVLVEGHCDPAGENPENGIDADALALDRAVAAAEAMLSASDMTPKLMEVAGHAAREPRGDGETAQGRRENRRVEVRVIALSRTRADHVAVLRENEKAGR